MIRLSALADDSKFYQAHPPRQNSRRCGWGFGVAVKMLANSDAAEVPKKCRVYSLWTSQPSQYLFLVWCGCHCCEAQIGWSYPKIIEIPVSGILWELPPQTLSAWYFCILCCMLCLFSGTIRGGTSPLSCLPLWSHQPKSAALGPLGTCSLQLRPKLDKHPFDNRDFYLEIHHVQVASSRFWGCVWD